MSLYLSRLQRRPCKNSCNTVHRPFMSLTELDAEENQPPRETMPVAVSLPCETSFIISINLIHQRFNTERLSGSELTVLGPGCYGGLSFLRMCYFVLLILLFSSLRYCELLLLASGTMCSHLRSGRYPLLGLQSKLFGYMKWLARPILFSRNFTPWIAL